METFFANLATNGGPSAVILLIGIMWVNSKLNGLTKQIDDLKEGKRWTETCEATHEEVNRRIERLETAQNGGK